MLVGLAFGLILAAAPASTDDGKGAALARWYEGPVRYLLTRREEKEFRALAARGALGVHPQFWRKPSGA
jgi:hypothetical protein